MKTKMLRLAMIDAINFGKDDWLMTAIRLTANLHEYVGKGREMKELMPIKHLRREIAKAVKEQRKNERERRRKKEEEEREWQETMRKQRIADAIYTGRTPA